MEVDPPHRLVYSWQGDPKHRATTVTWTLTPTADGGTRLKLEHTGFRGLGGTLLKWMLGSGWKKKFRDIAGGRTRRPTCPATTLDLTRRLSRWRIK